MISISTTPIITITTWASVPWVWQSGAGYSPDPPHAFKLGLSLFWRQSKKAQSSDWDQNFGWFQVKLYPWPVDPRHHPLPHKGPSWGEAGGWRSYWEHSVEIWTCSWEGEGKVGRSWDLCCLKLLGNFQLKRKDPMRNNVHILAVFLMENYILNFNGSRQVKIVRIKRHLSHLAGQDWKPFENGAILKETEPKAHLWTEHHIAEWHSKQQFWFFIAFDTLDFSKQIWVHICVKNHILFPLP